MTAPSASEIDGPIRGVERMVPAVSTLEGGGFQVLRPFPGPVVDWIDPFLLLDELPPNHIEPGKAIGAPAHPHRGFETVTYISRVSRAPRLRRKPRNHRSW